jgi:hypothetical protein
VEEIFRVGESEVFIVRGGKRGEILIPAVSAVIRDLAPREGRIVVDREALGLDEEVPQPRARGRLTTRARRAQERAAALPADAAGPPGAAGATGAASAADAATPTDAAAHGAAPTPTDGAADRQAPDPVTAEPPQASAATDLAEPA